MSFDLAHWRPGPLLQHAEGRGLGLFAGLVLLAFLASLAVAAGLFGARAVQVSRAPAAGSATVIVRGSGLESADAAAARAAEALPSLSGVARAEPLDAAPGDAGLGDLVGSGPGAPSAAPTRQVAVWFKPGAPVTASTLIGALKADGLAVRVDDHRLMDSPARRTLIVALSAVGGGLVLILIVAIVTISVAVRRALSGSRLVGLLRSAGAMDGLVAGLFEGRFAVIGAQGGMVGGLLAIAACAVWRSLAPGARGVDATTVLWMSLAGAAPWPLVMAVLGAWTARLTARGVLKRAP